MTADRGQWAATLGHLYLKGSDPLSPVGGQNDVPLYFWNALILSSRFGCDITTLCYTVI